VTNSHKYIDLKSLLAVSIIMQILSIQQVAQIMRKNIHWIYRNAAALGGIKIAGSWIFTAGNLEAAIEKPVATPSFAACRESSDHFARSKIATATPPPRQSSNRIDAELKHLAEKHGFNLDSEKGKKNAVQRGKIVRWPGQDQK